MEIPPPSRLEGRLPAIPDDKRDRRMLTRLGVWIAILAVVSVVVPVSTMEATAAEKQAAPAAPKATTRPAARYPITHPLTPARTVMAFLGMIAEGNGDQALAATTPQYAAGHPDGPATLAKVVDLSESWMTEMHIAADQACIIVGPVISRRDGQRLSLGFGLECLGALWLIRDIDLLPTDEYALRFIEGFWRARGLQQADRRAAAMSVARQFSEALRSGDMPTLEALSAGSVLGWREDRAGPEHVGQSKQRLGAYVKEFGERYVGVGREVTEIVPIVVTEADTWVCLVERAGDRAEGWCFIWTSDGYRMAQASGANAPGFKPIGMIHLLAEKYGRKQSKTRFNHETVSLAQAGSDDSRFCHGLDSGMTLPWPEGVSFAATREQALQWARSEGMDLFASPDPDRPGTVVALDMILVPVSNDLWRTLTPEQFQKVCAKTLAGKQPERWVALDENEMASYVFQARGGFRGLMQVAAYRGSVFAQLMTPKLFTPGATTLAQCVDPNCNYTLYLTNREWGEMIEQLDPELLRNLGEFRVICPKCKNPKYTMVRGFTCPACGHQFVSPSVLYTVRQKCGFQATRPTGPIMCPNCDVDVLDYWRKNRGRKRR